MLCGTGTVVHVVSCVVLCCVCCRQWKTQTSGHFCIHLARLCGSWLVSQCTLLLLCFTCWTGSVLSVGSNWLRVMTRRRTHWICQVPCGLLGAFCSTVALVKVYSIYSSLCNPLNYETKTVRQIETAFRIQSLFCTKLKPWNISNKLFSRVSAVLM